MGIGFDGGYGATGVKNPVGAISIAKQAEGLPCKAHGGTACPLANEFAPTKKLRPQESLSGPQCNNSNAAAVASWMRSQSPLRIQSLSIIQVPPTHITLGRAM